MIRVGESVTWPKVLPRFILLPVISSFCDQLHMIENRGRIEKQIFLGRQYIRTALRGRGRLPERLGSTLLYPDALTLNAVASSSRGLSPPQTNSDHPISVDPDAEAAFSRGSRWFFKRGHPRSSPSPPETVTLEEGSDADPLRSPTIRRKWTSELLSPTFNAPRPSMGDAANHTASGSVGQRPGGFLSRLGRKSFSNLASSLSGTSKRFSRESSEGSERGMSSDSSSDDDPTVGDGGIEGVHRQRT